MSRSKRVYWYQLTIQCWTPSQEAGLWPLIQVWVTMATGNPVPKPIREGSRICILWQVYLRGVNSRLLQLTLYPQVTNVSSYWFVYVAYFTGVFILIHGTQEYNPQFSLYSITVLCLARNVKIIQFSIWFTVYRSTWLHTDICVKAFIHCIQNRSIFYRIQVCLNRGARGYVHCSVRCIAYEQLE